MTRGGRAAAVALLAWLLAASAQAQGTQTPEEAYGIAPPPPPAADPDRDPGDPGQAGEAGEAGEAEGGAAALAAPAPEGALVPVPPPPSYGGAIPRAGAPSPYAPPPRDWERPPAEPGPPRDEDARRGSEMVELYIAGGAYGALGGGYLATVVGARGDGAPTFVLLGGLAGATGVLAADLVGEPFRTGVPPAIAMGLLGGLLDAAFLMLAFDGLVTTDEGRSGLLFAGATAGGVLGALLGTQTRPTIGDVRLVISTAAWGAWFAGMTALATDADEDTAWGMVLGAFNAGALVGLLLAPMSDLTGTRVMLLHVGVVAGALTGVMIVGAADSRGDLPAQEAGIAMGLGSLAGLVAAYLLVRPGDEPPAPDPAPRAGATLDAHPFVVPTADGRGALVGLGGTL